MERSASRVGHPPRTIDLDSPNGPADGLVRRNSLNADTDFKRGQLSGMEWMFQFWGRRPTVAGSVHGAEGESPTGRMPSGKLDMVAKLSRLPGPGEAVDGDRPLTLRFEFDPAIDSASIIAKELAEQLQFKKARMCGVGDPLSWLTKTRRFGDGERMREGRLVLWLLLGKTRARRPARRWTRRYARAR